MSGKRSNTTFEQPVYIVCFTDCKILVFEKDTRITPSTNAHGSLDYLDVLKNLGLTILAPLVVGQIIQWMFPQKVAAIKEKCRLGDINSLALLALVWSVFSDAIASNSFSAVGATDIVAIAIINAGFYISFSLFCMFAARLPVPRCLKTPKWVKKLRYSREDTVAVMVSGIRTLLTSVFILIDI